jgi:hypothetical protein
LCSAETEREEKMGSSWKWNAGFMVSEYYYMTKNLNSHIK